MSLLTSVRSVRRIYGNVHVNFGDPLAAGRFLDAQRVPTWRAARDETDGEWLRVATREAANELATRINAAAVLNPVSLVALALLATPRCTADALGPVVANDRTSRRWMRRHPIRHGASPAFSIRCRSSRMPSDSGIVEQVPHPFGNLVRVVDAQVKQLPYFRNNVLHLFAVPALIARLLGNNRRLDPQLADRRRCRYLRHPALGLFLRWSEAELLLEIQRTIGTSPGAAAASWRNRRLAAGAGANSQEFPELQMIGETLRPMLGRHFLALALLQQRGSRLADARGAGEKDCVLLAQRLALLHGFGETETADKSDFANLVASLLDAELLEEDQGACCASMNISCSH